MSRDTDNPSQWHEDDEEIDPDGQLSDRDLPLPEDMDDPSDDSPETIPCPYCHKPVYEQAEVCPHCRSYIVEGYEDSDKPARLDFAKIVAAILLILGILAVAWALGLFRFF